MDKYKEIDELIRIFEQLDKQRKVFIQGFCPLADVLYEKGYRKKSDTFIEIPCPIDSKVYYIVKTFKKSGDLSSKYYHIIQGKATWGNMPRVICEWGKTCFGDIETAQKVKKQLENT